MLDAVESLLAEGESFTSLGVGDIAARAGVARSSFYVHFTDKTALLLRVTESATRSLFEVAEAWVLDPQHDLDGLGAACERMLAEHRKHASLLAAFAEVASYEPEVADFWRERVGEFITLLKNRMEADRKAGRIPAGTDCGVLAAFATWGMERTVAQYVVETTSTRRDKRFAAGLAAGIWSVLHPSD